MILIMQAVMQVTTIHTRDDGGQKTPHNNKFQRSHLHASAAAQGDALWGVDRSDNSGGYDCAKKFKLRALKSVFTANSPE